MPAALPPFFKELPVSECSFSLVWLAYDSMIALLFFFMMAELLMSSPILPVWLRLDSSLSEMERVN